VRTSSSTLAIVCLFTVLTSSCDKPASAPAPGPGGKPAAKGLPPADSAAPAAADPPKGLPAGHPELPANHPALSGSDPAVGAVQGQVVSGTIDVAPAMKDLVKPGDTIFLVARSIDASGAVQRMPVAVDRAQVGSFPLAFELSAKQVMVAGTPFTGPMQITARVDKDGEAMTRQPGDVEGTARVTVPAKGVQIVLDTPVKP
jgi:cytochrome c-type biogenesis protein CcmH